MNTKQWPKNSLFQPPETNVTIQGVIKLSDKQRVSELQQTGFPDPTATKQYVKLSPLPHYKVTKTSKMVLIPGL